MPTNLSATPHSLRLFEAPYAITGRWRSTNTGAPREVHLTDSGGALYTFYFADGQSEARPNAMVYQDRLLLRMLDISQQSTTQVPSFYELRTETGDAYVFLADPPDPADFGRLHLVRSSSGAEVPASATLHTLIRGAEGEPRQLRGPASLVDVTVLHEHAFQIALYDASAFSPVLVDGLYPLLPGAIPRETRTIEQPDPDNINHLRHTLVRDDETNVRDFHYNPENRHWAITVNGGLEPLTAQSHSEDLSDADRKNRWIHQWYTQPGIPQRYAHTVQHWQDLGGHLRLLAETADPDGLALTTAHSYYTSASEAGRYRNLRQTVQPDGSWVAYDYDSQRRIILELKPWLDSPASPPANPATSAHLGDATFYGHTPHLSEDSLALNDQRPRTVTRQVLGVVVERRYYVYGLAPDGHRYEIEEQAHSPAAPFGDPLNLRRTTHYFGLSSPTWLRGRIQSITEAGGQLTTYSYERGTWFDATQTFTPDPDGLALRTLRTSGTTNFPDGIAHQTTQERETHDLRGRSVFSERLVYTGTTYQPFAWEHRRYDLHGELSFILRSTGETTTYVKRASCCGADETTGPDGITTKTEHDGRNRVLSRIKTSADADPGKDLITEYLRDPAGHILLETLRDGSNTLSLSTFYNVDGTGRRTQTILPHGGTNTTEYLDTERTMIQTGADGSTIITTRYRDGRLKSITGTGTIHQTYDYGVNPDGSQWTKVYSGPDGTASPLWRKSTSDMFDRPLREEQPAFGGAVLATQYAYNNLGQLVSVTPADGSAPILYQYNALNERVAAVRDINRNGLADDAGPDRISRNESGFVEAEGDLWRYGSAGLHADQGTNTFTHTGTSRQRLTGLGVDVPGKGLLVAESLAIDLHGNETRTRRYLDRSNRLERVEQQSPFADQPAISIRANGLLVETTTPTGNTSSYRHDALERPVGQTDPRFGESTQTYDNRGLVIARTDPAGHSTTYTYDLAARPLSVTDPNTNTTHTAYDALGRVAAQWGATYPVVFDYDDFGRMTQLHTLRDTNVVFNPTIQANGQILTSDLSPLTTATDVTTWTYDGATGLLTQKTYADGHGPSYTYTPDGRLATRTWARGVTTTYGYDTNTLELLTVSYSDGTPGVTNTYDRLGRITQIDDAFGQKTYAYTETLQPASETWTGLITNQITRTYDSLGRYTGFETTGGLPAGAEWTSTSAYAANGRLATIAHGFDTNVTTATYTYEPDTDLVSGYSLTSDLSPLTTHTRAVSFEAHRPLVDLVSNAYGTNLISRFDYTNDPAGRRVGREDSGQAFLSTQANSFGYNTRSELISATMRNGNSSYNFDQIGNRRSAADPAAESFYTANALNQYLSISNETSVVTPTYDLDGNMLHGPAGTSGSILGFEWNGENRMVTVTNGTTVVHNTYDSQGRRVRKLVTESGTPSKDIRFLYDGWNPILEIDLLAPADAKHYAWGLDLSQSMQGAGGVGGLLAVLTPNSHLPSSTHAATYDANGNVTEYVDLTDGSITAHLEYDAFGRLIASTGTRPCAFGFSTKFEDVETGMVYYGFRYYHPELGRWPNRDPIGEMGGVNVYGVDGNDVVGGVDFLGLYFGMEIALSLQAEEFYGFIDKQVNSVVAACPSGFQTRCPRNEACKIAEGEINDLKLSIVFYANNIKAAHKLAYQEVGYAVSSAMILARMHKGKRPTKKINISGESDFFRRVVDRNSRGESILYHNLLVGLLQRQPDFYGADLRLRANFAHFFRLLLGYPERFEVFLSACCEPRENGSGR